jgi:prophage regulatory protein
MKHHQALTETAGLLRLSSILAPNGPIPMGKSSWWLGVKQGRLPKPVKLGKRTTAWRVEDIEGLVERGANLGATQRERKQLHPG